MPSNHIFWVRPFLYFSSVLIWKLIIYLLYCSHYLQLLDQSSLCPTLLLPTLCWTRLFQWSMYVSHFPLAGMKITINTWNHVINEAFALLSRVMVATTFIVFGNIFLVSFGNHQSPGMGCSICHFYYMWYLRNICNVEMCDFGCFVVPI